MRFIYFLFFLFSTQSSAYDFENLYIQMNNDINELDVQIIKKKSNRNDDIRVNCNSLKKFPVLWKENFSKKHKINIDSIKFLGATIKEEKYSPSCSVKSSSDRGVCKHNVLFHYKTNKVFSISDECK